jgi:hypothetical protein
MENRDYYLATLVEAFGQRITEPRLRIYKKWIDRHNIDTAKWVLDEIIAEEPRFPTISVLNKYAQMCRNRNIRTYEHDDEDEDECMYCDNTGMVPAIWQGKEDLQLITGVLCQCSCRSRNHYKGITPQFLDDPRFKRVMDLAKEHKTTPWGALIYVDK